MGIKKALAVLTCISMLFVTVACGRDNEEYANHAYDNEVKHAQYEQTTSDAVGEVETTEAVETTEEQSSTADVENEQSSTIDNSSSQDVIDAIKTSLASMESFNFKSKAVTDVSFDAESLGEDAADIDSDMDLNKQGTLLMDGSVYGNLLHGKASVLGDNIEYSDTPSEFYVDFGMKYADFMTEVRKTDSDIEAKMYSYYDLMGWIVTETSSPNGLQPITNSMLDALENIDITVENGVCILTGDVPMNVYLNSDDSDTLLVFGEIDDEAVMPVEVRYNTSTGYVESMSIDITQLIMPLYQEIVSMMLPDDIEETELTERVAKAVVFNAANMTYEISDVNNAAEFEIPADVLKCMLMR